MERRMTDAVFTDLGSLYFERDLPLETRRTCLRLMDENDAIINHDGYCIGPSVARRFWRGGRAHMQIDRGPCTPTVILTFSRQQLMIQHRG